MTNSCDRFCASRLAGNKTLVAPSRTLERIFLFEKGMMDFTRTQQQQQDGKSAQAAQYASLLMNLTGRGVVDARTKSDELKKSTDNS